MKEGTKVWVYTNDLGYVRIYQASIVKTPNKDDTRILVHYEDKFFDNDNDYSLKDKVLNVRSFTVYPSYEILIEALRLDKRDLIPDILESLKVAK